MSPESQVSPCCPAICPKKQTKICPASLSFIALIRDLTAAIREKFGIRGHLNILTAQVGHDTFVPIFFRMFSQTSCDMELLAFHLVDI